MRPSRQPAFIALISALLFISAAAPVAAAPPDPRALAQDSWIVTLVADADPAESGDLARAVGGAAGHVYTHALNGFQFMGSAQAAAALERSPRVASVTADSALELTETLPWGVKRVSAYLTGGATGAYQAGFRGNGARIAILDTGIDLDHPDLAAAIDGALGRNCITDGAAPNDGYGHGTHVAGTAAAPLNGVGVVGVAPQARLVAVKMFTDSGSSSQAIALCALDHVIGLNADADDTNDVDVVNMSWGEQRSWGDCASDPLHTAICRAHAEGMILVAGAGNSSADAGTFVPAAYPEVLSVSALADFDGVPGGLGGCGFVMELFANECDDTFAFFSNRGPSVDVIAPGVRVYSTWKDGGWTTNSGTSMATPHVAGVAALMAAAVPGLTPDAARAALLTSGECPNGQAADTDGASGCAGQGTWRDDPDGIPEPMVHALRAAQAAVAAATPEAPGAPVLTASATTTSVELSWTAPVDDGGSALTGFEVFRSADGAAWTPIAAVDATVVAYSDTNVAADQTWHYRVDASNAIGTTPSNVVTVTVPAEPPPPPAPPSAPTLSAAATFTSIELSWTAPVDDGGSAVTNYLVYRRSPADAAMTALATIGPELAYSDTAVAPGETWIYQVAAVNAAGTGTPSSEVPATVPNPSSPSAPTLSATRGNGSVTLNWAAPTNDGGAPVTNYEIYRGTTSGSLSLVATVGNVLTWRNTGLTNGVTYWFHVRAVNSAGPGDPSNEVSATPATVPSPPRSLKVARSGSSLQLTWVAPSSDGGSPITNYRIHRTDGTGAALIRTIGVPSPLGFLDTQVAPKQWYAYVVTAINAVGESTASNIVYVKSP